MCSRNIDVIKDIYNRIVTWASTMISEKIALPIKTPRC